MYVLAFVHDQSIYDIQKSVSPCVFQSILLNENILGNEYFVIP